jgi:hypothetical protein
VHNLLLHRPVQQLSAGLGLPGPSPAVLGGVAGAVELPIDRPMETITRIMQVGGIAVGAMSGQPVLVSACFKSLVHDEFIRGLARGIEKTLTERGAVAERAPTDRATPGRTAADRAAADRAAAGRAATERAAEQRAATDQAAAEERAVADRAAERTAAMLREARRAAAERRAAELRAAHPDRDPRDSPGRHGPGISPFG